MRHPRPLLLSPGKGTQGPGSAGGTAEPPDCRTPPEALRAPPLPQSVMNLPLSSELSGVNELIVPPLPDFVCGQTLFDLTLSAGGSPGFPVFLPSLLPMQPAVGWEPGEPPVGRDRDRHSGTGRWDI